MATILNNDIFNLIFLYENLCILIQFSSKFISRSPINNTPILIQIMAQCLTGDKQLLFEPSGGDLSH